MIQKVTEPENLILEPGGARVTRAHWGMRVSRVTFRRKFGGQGGAKDRIASLFCMQGT